jgi:hypothetical protein
LISYHDVVGEKACGHLAESNGKPPTSDLLSKGNAMTHGDQQPK